MKSEHKANGVGRREFLRTLGVSTAAVVTSAPFVDTARADTESRDERRRARYQPNSPLVQTALYGHDPNWGRIAQAAGMALAGEPLDELGPDHIDAEGLGTEDAEAEISIRLGRGERLAHVYFSDLNHDYIRINAEYTT